MSDLQVRLHDEEIAEAAGWQLSWVDRERGIARLTDGVRTLTALVEGAGTEWFVTLAGRRISVSVLSWRERVLAEARLAAAESGGPIQIHSTLPGLVVAVSAVEGSDVEAGDPLVTIEAMKMQNEVRAPRAGRIGAVAVAPGQPVATGALLLSLD